MTRRTPIAVAIARAVACLGPTLFTGEPLSPVTASDIKLCHSNPHPPGTGLLHRKPNRLVRLHDKHAPVTGGPATSITQRRVTHRTPRATIFKELCTVAPFSKGGRAGLVPANYQAADFPVTLAGDFFSERANHLRIILH